MEQESTKTRIEKCALKEFLEKGFNGASLRHIVNRAGVTTGAFYKYYPSKEALFEGLAGPVADHIYQAYEANYHEFAGRELSSQVRDMSSNKQALTGELIDYMYEHHEIMRLILTASEGTAYADFIHNLALLEEQSTFAFAEALRKSGADVPSLDSDFVHMIASGMFSAIFETILHNMEIEKAKERIRMLQEFYTAGWEKIFGVKLQ